MIFTGGCTCIHIAVFWHAVNPHTCSVSHELVTLMWCAEHWDANIFCQERTQLFRLSGFLHDQVELTGTGRALTENTPHAVQSPRARPAGKRAAAAPRNHQVSQVPHFEPQAHQPNHRAPQANPRRETMPVGSSAQLEAHHGISPCFSVVAALQTCQAKVSLIQH